MGMTLANLEARPGRHSAEETARRLAELVNAYAINTLSGGPALAPMTERLLKLLASGRIKEREYLKLAHALAQSGDGKSDRQDIC